MNQIKGWKSPFPSIKTKKPAGHFRSHGGKLGGPSCQSAAGQGGQGAAQVLHNPPETKIFDSWKMHFLLGNRPIFHPDPGEMIQFDDHIFPRGWFNHQLDSPSVER